MHLTGAHGRGAPEIGRQMTTFDHRPRRFTWRTALVLVLLSLVAAGVGWASATVLSPPSAPLKASPYTLVELAEGEVGASIQLNTAVNWPTVPLAANQASGIVTSVNAPQGGVVDQGSILYTVNLRPVVIAQGDVPAFQMITLGTKGRDVAQLQQLLTDLGFYGGTIDGDVGQATDRAIRAWQKSLSIPVDGQIQQSDVIFVPSLPLRITLDSSILRVGGTVGGGEDAILAIPASPRFAIPTTPEQASRIPAGTAVEITTPAGGKWSALAGEQEQTTEGGIDIRLEPLLEGDAICAAECEEVPISGQTLLASSAITVPSAAGVIVPSAALVTTPNGETSVIDESGKNHEVRVVTAAKGMAIIEGLEPGMRVQIPTIGG